MWITHGRFTGTLEPAAAKSSGCAFLVTNACCGWPRLRAKTRVLTYRIAYLIGVLGVPPYHILAVTFTNKAAREMRERVEKLIGNSGQGIWLGTFHSVCGRILRREAICYPLIKTL